MLIPNRYGLDTNYSDGVTAYLADKINRIHGAAKSQLGPLVDTLGPGIIHYPDETSFEVTTDTGLQVAIAPGLGIALHSTKGGVVLQWGSSVLRTVPASSTSYIFAAIDTSSAVTDSRVTGQPVFVVNDTDEYDGGILLASVVTSGSAVTAITDLREPIELQDVFDTGLRSRGDWDSGETYAANAVVKHASAYWLALQASTNEEPEDGSAFWDLIGTSVDGSVWRDGEGVPDDALGSDGDYYLDSETGDFYKRTGGAYELRGNLTGPQGVQGYSVLVNPGAPPSGDGVNGDGWFDSDTGDVYKKVSGSWVLLGNTQGPPGADGAPGPSGGTWTWVDDGWLTATDYVVDNALAHGEPASSYRCTVDHTSGPTTEPGVGVDWATVWEVVAAAGEPGADGAAWSSGSGAPDNGDGVDGDWYFDFTALRWYTKESGSWVLKASVPSVAPRLVTGSTSSVIAGLGSKTWTIPSARSYDVGMRLRIIPDADITAWMEGQITAYSGGSLTVLVDLTGPGTGTFTSWNVVVAGEPGADGILSGSAGGDLSGTYPNPTVAKIQGIAVSATDPTDGQVLAYDSGTSQYVPVDQTGGGGGPSGYLFRAVLANVPVSNRLGMRAVGEADITDIDDIGDAADWKAAIESNTDIAIAPVVANSSTTGTYGKTGFVDIGTVEACPELEVVQGEVRSLTGAGPITYNGATISAGDSADTARDSIQFGGSGTGDDQVAVVGGFPFYTENNGGPAYFPAPDLVDGDTGSPVGNLGAPNLCGYIFAGTPPTVSTVRMYLDGGSSYTIGFSVQTSDNSIMGIDGNWAESEAVSVIYDSGTPGWYDVPITIPIEAKGIRFLVVSAASACQIYELEFNGTPFPDLIDLSVCYPASLGNIAAPTTSGGTVSTVVEGGTATTNPRVVAL